MSIIFRMCSKGEGEYRSTLVMTTDPHSIAALTVVLLARTPRSKNAAKNVVSCR